MDISYFFQSSTYPFLHVRARLELLNFITNKHTIIYCLTFQEMWQLYAIVWWSLENKHTTDWRCPWSRTMVSVSQPEVMTHGTEWIITFNTVFVMTGTGATGGFPVILVCFEKLSCSQSAFHNLLLWSLFFSFILYIQSKSQSQGISDIYISAYTYEILWWCLSVENWHAVDFMLCWLQSLWYSKNEIQFPICCVCVLISIFMIKNVSST